MARDRSAWPEDGLEHLSACPVCNCEDAEVIHEALADLSFRVAPGTWTMWKCRECGSAFLNPRPDRRTIGQAYGRYYTHERTEEACFPTVRDRIRHVLANDYRRWRFGLRGTRRIPGGRWIGRIWPDRVVALEADFRFLPPPNRGVRRLLDVGSGNGEFLALAERAGWQGFGVEPDDQAANLNLAATIRPAIEDWLDHPRYFDAVTLHHSIEHLHDPVGTLELIARLMKPGGFLYVETPNINAVGHRLYGEFWRGLEAPRHLVLFTAQSLRNAVERSGFSDVQFRKRPSPLDGLSRLSRRMALGLDPYEHTDVPLGAPPPPSDEDRVAETRTDQSEILTLTARLSK